MRTYLKSHSTGLMIASFVAVFWWLQTRIQSILPAVMQDEYIYSMQARKIPLADLDYPNYLYSWVFSQTNQCGVNFYSCAKNFNLFFFAAFVALVFWTAYRLLGKHYAYVIALATSLSPLGAYTSLFMPESMYFFFALASLVAIWLVVDRVVWWQLALAGSLMGLTALVKPHALFLALAVVVYLAWMRFPNIKSWLTQSGFYLAGTLAAKFGLGFLFAGTNGLTFFGENYTNSFSGFIEDLTAKAPAILQLASGAGFNLGSEAAVPNGNLATEIWHQLLWQGSAAVLLVGALLVVLLGSLKAPKEQADEQSLSRLLLSASGTMVIVIAGFAAMVTLSGDDHSSRLLLRYYEFLFPVLAIPAIAIMTKSVRVGAWWKWLLSLLVAIVGVVSYIFVVQDVKTLFSDSPSVMGLTYTSQLGVLVVALAIAAAVTPQLGIRKLGVYFTALVLAMQATLGVASLQRLSDQASVISPVDSAGIFARDFLATADAATIHYVGTSRPLALASIFWLDKPDVKFTLVNPLEQISMSSIPTEVQWIVTLGGAGVDVTPRYAINGTGWSVLNVSSEKKHTFTQQMQSTPLASVGGLGPVSAEGQWVLGERAELKLSEPFQSATVVTIEFLVGNSGEGQSVMFQLGDQSVSVDLPAPGSIATASFNFAASSDDALVIATPLGTERLISLLSISFHD